MRAARTLRPLMRSPAATSTVRPGISNGAASVAGSTSSSLKPLGARHRWSVANPVTNLIGSVREDASILPTYTVVHPVNGKVHAVQHSTAVDIEQALACAHGVLPSWSGTPLSERKEIFNRVADLLESPEWNEKLHAMNRAETSVPEWWSKEQLKVAPGMIRALVNYADEALKETTETMGEATFHVTREPYGVCLAIAAWNAVHLLTLRAIITPLLTGNTVVLKTSEITPGSQALWAELLYEAGVPRTALSVVHAAPDEAPGLTEQLISDRRVRHVNFTGSTRVGRIVASLAGQGLKPCIMELGGKAPVLLLPDADIETAASHILMGAFFNQGQVCMSTERVLVPESRFSELVTALQKAWGEVQDKTPKAPFKPDAVARMRDLVDDAVSKGAQMLLPLEEASEGTFPHQILGPATQDMRIWSEETFGPLAIVIPVPDDGAIDTMVDIANESEYGLTASVWGKDLKQAEAVARRLQSGAVHINSPTANDPPIVPHGGWKSSGFGRFNTIDGLRGFTQTRSIEVPKGSGPLPLNVFGL